MMLGSLVLNVAALPEAERFFTEGLGLRVRDRSAAVVVLDTQPIAIALRQSRVDLNLGLPHLGWGAEIVLATNDVRALVRRAVAHGALVVEPVNERPEARSAEIETPLGGYRLVLVEPRA